MEINKKPINFMQCVDTKNSSITLELFYSHLPTWSKIHLKSFSFLLFSEPLSTFMSIFIWDYATINTEYQREAKMQIVAMTRMWYLQFLEHFSQIIFFVKYSMRHALIIRNVCICTFRIITTIMIICHHWRAYCRLVWLAHIKSKIRLRNRS